MLAQACIGYDVRQTLILIRMFAGRIILVLYPHTQICYHSDSDLWKMKAEFGNINSVE